MRLQVLAVPTVSDQRNYKGLPLFLFLALLLAPNDFKHYAMFRAHTKR